MFKHVSARLYLAFLCVIVAFLACMLAANSFLMPRYFSYRRESIIRDSFIEVAKTMAAYEKGELTVLEYSAGLQSVGSKNGVRIVIIMPSKETVIYGDKYDAEILAKGETISQKPAFLTQEEAVQRVPNLDTSVLCLINRRKDAQTDLEYISMVGSVSCSKIPLFVIIDTTMQASDLSINITNSFLIYSCVGIGVLGCILLAFASRGFVKPIVQMNTVAGRIARMDFSAKVDVGGNDEIAMLGNSINELSSKLEETITSLQTANMQLKLDLVNKEKTDTMRKEFISNVSHELKTPIALISGYAEGLKVGINEEDRDFYCDVIADEANNMSKLVSRLLYVSQIDSGAMTPEMSHFALDSIVDGCLENHSLQLRESGITVQKEFECPGEVNADIDQIRQVVTNYLTNAEHHIGGSKVITLRIYETGSHRVRFEAENTGDQIPPEIMPHLWESFYKADRARTREYGGTGLGLYIVSRIIENHNGVYGVSNTASGVCFWFELDGSSN